MMLSTAENRDRISRHEESDMGLMRNRPLETMKRALYVFFCLAIACAQPGAITTVVGAYPDGDGGPADARPLKAGEYVVIYATGLGMVDIPVVDGAPAPSGPFALPKNRITVTIQGKNAPVVFAGLAPGFGGVYQINAQVPADVTPDAAAQLIVVAGEQPSPPVTLAVTRTQ